MLAAFPVPRPTAAVPAGRRGPGGGRSAPPTKPRPRAQRPWPAPRRPGGSRGGGTICRRPGTATATTAAARAAARDVARPPGQPRDAPAAGAVQPLDARRVHVGPHAQLADALADVPEPAEQRVPRTRDTWPAAFAVLLTTPTSSPWGLEAVALGTASPALAPAVLHDAEHLWDRRRAGQVPVDQQQRQRPQAAGRDRRHHGGRRPQGARSQPHVDQEPRRGGHRRVDPVAAHPATAPATPALIVLGGGVSGLGRGGSGSPFLARGRRRAGGRDPPVQLVHPHRPRRPPQPLQRLPMKHLGPRSRPVQQLGDRPRATSQRSAVASIEQPCVRHPERSRRAPSARRCPPAAWRAASASPGAR